MSWLVDSWRGSTSSSHPRGDRNDSQAMHPMDMMNKVLHNSRAGPVSPGRARAAGPAFAPGN